MEKIVCIVGPSCAGKTTFSGFLAEELGCEFYGASSIPRRRYKESNREIPLMEFVFNEFKTKGMSTFSHELFQQISEKGDCKSSLIIIDGFRASEEVDFFSENFNELEVFGIYANSKTRFERHTRRFRDSPISTYGQFIEKDMMEYTFGIARMLGEYTKEIIVNEDTLESLEKKATLLAKRL